MAVDFSAIDLLKMDDAVLPSLPSKFSYKFKEFPVFGSFSSICCEISEKGHSPHIPAVFCLVVFCLVHYLAHIRSSNLLVSSKYLWRYMNKDIIS